MRGEISGALLSCNLCPTWSFAIMRQLLQPTGSRTTRQRKMLTRLFPKEEAPSEHVFTAFPGDCRKGPRIDLRQLSVEGARNTGTSSSNVVIPGFQVSGRKVQQNKSRTKGIARQIINRVFRTCCQSDKDDWFVGRVHMSRLHKGNSTSKIASPPPPAKT